MATQILKRLDPEGDAFHKLIEIFPYLSIAKLRAGILNGPEIKKLMLDNEFASTLPQNFIAAWNSLKDLVQNFLGNHKARNYEEIVVLLI